MIRECLLPELGENITTATVVSVLVAAGDVIEVDQPVLSLETDKAEFEMPSPVAGRVTELLVEAGAEVAVGHLLFRVETDGSAAAAEPSAAAVRQDQPQPRVGAKPRSRAEQPSQAGQAEPTTDDSGERAAAASQAKPTAAAVSAGPGATADSQRAIAAAPSVRRLARELGIDVGAVAPSAEHGRVTSDDVLRHARSLISSASSADAAVAGTELVDFTQWGPVDREPMTKVRRRTAEQMALAWSEIPHVTHYDKADISELDSLRKRYAQRAEKAGGKLTLTAVLLKVLGAALRRYAKFNASIDMARGEIVLKRYVNVGVAVDTERGLLVPVVRGVDDKNIIEIARELRELSERARGRNIRPEMLQGASFTLTNLGGIGGSAFSPLINPPEVAVLGVASARREPRWVDGEFEPRLMLPLSVSYDHRLIDGADAARFLRWVCEALEEPFVLELEGE